MDTLTKVPKGIGKGEGGGRLPSLEAIFEEIDSIITTQQQQITDLENQVSAQQQQITDLENRVSALESGGA